MPIQGRVVSARRSLALLASWAAVGCANPLPDAPAAGAGAARSVTLTFEPSARVDAAPSVLRIHLHAEPALGEMSELALFSDLLSAYYERRLRERVIPDTLATRRIAVSTWFDGDRNPCLAPQAALEPGQSYSVAAAGLGGLGTFTVSSEQPAPFWSRSWPPQGTGSRARRAVYCGLGDAPPPGALSLEPGAWATTLERGADSLATAGERCVHFELPQNAGQESLTPPPVVAGIALDPAPIVFVDSQPSAAVVCDSSELELGPGCAELDDDRITIRSQAAATFWTGRAEGLEFVSRADGASRFVWRGFTPDSPVKLDVSVLDLAGNETAASVQWRSAPPRAHLVINEVLANPVGAEPAQEWIELMNDGTVPVDTSGFTLSDAGGESTLPGHTLASGELVRLVSESFTKTSAGDVEPPSDCILLRAPKLGKNGVSNSGEALLLRDAAGRVLSRFPAVAADKAGVSVARREPWALDDDASAFALHAPPGASPCRANRLSDASPQR